MNENELMHYGVPGMRWGVRKNRISKSAKIKEARAKNAELTKRRQTEIEKRKKVL